MSNAVLPLPPGLAWSVFKTPIWATDILTSSSGRELATARWSYPRWKFRLTYDVLRADATAELQTMVGFFNARQGSADSFLFSDASDSSVTAQSFGVGNGTATQFQLVRSLGGFVEPIRAVNGVPTIYVNGVSTTAFTESNALITFSSPPANGAVLTWTGSFYFRCRFMRDEAEFEQFLKDLWNFKKCEFISLKA